MNLEPNPDSLLVQDAFERFFAQEATSPRVRDAEPVGFDPELWRQLVEMGAPAIRLDEHYGGGGSSLFDALLMMEEAGRRLAPAPLAESIVALRVLGEVGGQSAAGWIERVLGGNALVALALHSVCPGVEQLVPGGAVATAILALDDAGLAIYTPRTPLAAPRTLGGNAVGVFDPADCDRTGLLEGQKAIGIWQAAIEEWKLLTAAALTGLSQEALVMASAYASERVQFGVPIGTYQGISHPLANGAIDTDGGRLLLWRALAAIAAKDTEAGALVALAYWWACKTAGLVVAHAVHVFGGYGLTNEYDIQLYHRRAKAWALPLGDPADQLAIAGARLFQGTVVALPDVGPVPINISVSEAGLSLAAETRAVFESVLTPALRAKAHHSFEGHDWTVSRALGEARLIYPDWPEEWGGRNVDPLVARASTDVWDEYGWTTNPRGTTLLVGRMLMAFGDATVAAELLPRMARGEIIASLGYTEPSCGSDVFAAKTRAVRDGEDWIINGQKMFTSGADMASHVLLLTRTDTEAPKHRGVTLFLVPLDAPGVEIHPVETFMDERTTATFYSEVRLSDRFRVGEINGGVKVMSAALQMEQGGANYHKDQRRLVAVAASWARKTVGQGRDLLGRPDILSRLARVICHATIGEMLAARATWTHAEGRPDVAFGPASKVFTTETYISDSADLLEMTSPDSLVRGREGLGQIEEAYRHATATTIYAGTSEVLRSLVAERRLGLPRSRT